MMSDPTPVSGVDATAAETAGAADDITTALIRLVLDNPGSGEAGDAYEQKVFRAAETLGIDLHAALTGYFLSDRSR